MNIYDIDMAILECIDQETGEIIDEDMLTSLQMERNTKIENVACWVKNLKAEASAIAGEIKALQARKKSAENKVESLTNYLNYALAGKKFSTSKVNISYRKSESVEVDDISKLDKRFLRYAEPTADKTEIQRAIKAEGPIEGARLITNKNMIIK